MPNEQVDWIRLDDVLAAAERCLAPIGPELAGFIVLETAQRLRELGGVLDSAELAIGTSGHVALTAPPTRGDEEAAAKRLRQLLGKLLAVATSSTPALRQCSKRKDSASLALLCRELEGALIPLNRAASRRGLARVARATLEAIDSGRLEPAATQERSDSEPPPVEVAARPRSTPPPLPPRRVAQREPTPRPAEIEDRTPSCVPVFDEFEEEEVDPLGVINVEATPFEIVSRFTPVASDKPPIVAAVEPPPHPTFTFTVEPMREDRVAKLLETFEVSRRRDDPALARDLKAMVGIETNVPPPATVRVKVRPRSERNDEIAIEHELPRESSVVVDDEPVPPPPKKRGGMFAILALTVVACGLAAVAARPAALDALLGPPLPPPGDAPAAANTPLVAPRMPMVCEASLTLDGVPSGAEVLRRVGSTPLTVSMPMHVPFDLVATMDGHAPRRAHVDASAIWQKDGTGARLEVPFALDTLKTSATDSKWPAATGVVPLRVQNDPPRGLLRATSTPNGATLWLVVDPSSVTSLPCGSGVELMVVPGSGPHKTVHVDWGVFAGSPPRAVAKL